MKIKFLHTVLVTVILSIPALSFAQTDPLNEVFNSYVSLKNSLAADNAKEAAANSQILYNLIKNLSPDKLSAEQLEIWTKYSSKLSHDADHISETTNIKHQREHFGKLSKNFYEVIQSFKTNSKDVYYQYCPMHKAYWMSEQQEINDNPYEGKKMPDCGNNSETIKSSK